MALTQNWNVEWLFANSQRRYPLSAEVSARDVTGAFELPNDFIIGLYLPIHVSLSVSVAKFTIKSIGAYATGFTVTVGYDNGTTVLPVASASISVEGHEPGQTYTLRGLGNFYDTVGQLVIGKLDAINAQPPGQWEFDLVGGRLEVDAIRPQIRGVTQIRVQNGSSLSDPIVGDIILQARRNTRITPVVESGEDPVISFDAISGEGLNEVCVCDGDVEEAPAIRTINQIPPTADGNFTFLGNDCLELEPVDNGLQLKDACSTPCCGCKELERITADFEAFGEKASTLANFLASLEARATQLDQVVLGSKLGDRGCGCE